MASHLSIARPNRSNRAARPAERGLSLRVCLVCGRLPHAVVVVSMPGRPDLTSHYCEKDLPDLQEVAVMIAPLGAAVMLAGRSA